MYSSKIFNTLVLCTSLTLFGCQSTAPKATTTTAKNVNQVQQENANGFKARIAVSSFTD